MPSIILISENTEVKKKKNNKNPYPHWNLQSNLHNMGYNCPSPSW